VKDGAGTQTAKWDASYGPKGGGTGNQRRALGKDPPPKKSRKLEGNQKLKKDRHVERGRNKRGGRLVGLNRREKRP